MQKSVMLCEPRMKISVKLYVRKRAKKMMRRKSNFA